MLGQLCVPVCGGGPSTRGQECRVWTACMWTHIHGQECGLCVYVGTHACIELSEGFSHAYVRVLCYSKQLSKLKAESDFKSFFKNMRCKSLKIIFLQKGLLSSKWNLNLYDR